MYQVEAATWPALLSKSPKIQPRAIWYFGTGAGDQLDVSDRIVGEIPPTESRAGPFLDGFDTAPISLALNNKDKAFSRTNSESLLANTPISSVYMTKLATFARVERADGTSEDIPTSAGLVRGSTLSDGLAELRADGYGTILLDTKIPEEIPISHEWTSPFDHRSVESCKDLIDDYSPLASGTDLDSATLTSVAEMLYVIGWPLTGRIPSTATIGDAMAALARSCMFQFYAKADGTLALETELPHAVTSYPEHFDESNAWDWSYDDGLDDYTSEVIVRYRNGVEGSYRNEDNESTFGRRPEVVNAAFMATYWQARWSARFLYEMFGGVVPRVRFSTDARALPMEANDRIAVTPPDTGIRMTARVMSKSWDGASAYVEAAALGHESTIIDGTFRTWDRAAIGTGAML
jgi:hypothetical protein